ncbi:MAG: translation repressor RelE [Parcubacteria group bacterium Gr01-1014_30]|nr:MAG: translation repressor RelE [Parcubacteria group bacterium Gr01-1014_30]
MFFHKHFDKRFAKLPIKIQRKALEIIQLFRKEPYAQILDNHALGGKYLGLRSIDITGDFRAIYDPLADDSAHFVDVGKHSQLYR